VTRQPAQTSTRRFAGRAAVVATIVAVAFGGAVPTAAHAAAPAGSAEQRTDQYLFHMSLGDFADARTGHPADDGLRWTSDGCSVPAAATTLLGRKNEPGVRTIAGQMNRFPFLNACRRHDFGYRNYKDQGRFTPDAKARIDKNFHDDMYSVCRKYKGFRHAWEGVVCRRYADVYYRAVKAYGR